jgi:tape measure domain-containing protein
MNLDAVLRIAAKVTGMEAVLGLGKGLAGVGKEADKTVRPLQGMGSAIRGLASIAGAVGLGFIARDLVQAGAEAQAAETRINALAKSYGETSAVAAVAAKAASQFALGNVDAKNAVTDLYGRLRPMGVSLKEIETVFFGVSKAAKMVGLSSADTEGVMLQLSQALGSGKLQGDELRSIMERMPAVGQAVAKVMGVAASEIKKLGSEGKITTEIMIQAAAELNKLQPPPPTPLQEYEKALKDLRTEFGENLLPLITPVIQGITGLVKAFAALPEPLQTAIVVLGGLALAAGAVVTAIGFIGPAFLAGAAAVSGLGATIAGFAGAIGPVVAAIGAVVAAIGLWPIVIGAAVVAAIALIWNFRDEIGAFFQWLAGKAAEGWDAFSSIAGNIFSAIANAYQNIVVKPLVGAWRKIVDTAKAALRGLLGWAASAINGVINMVNRIIAGINRVRSLAGLSQFSTIGPVTVPAFAQGGYVTSPTLGLVGEAGKEYIVPEAKAAGFANNIMAGRRGAAAIPAGTSSSGGGAVSINITTGPVRQDASGQRWMTIEDGEKMVRQAVGQMQRTSRTPGGRYASGVR